MDGRPNRRKTAAFSNLSGVMRTGPESFQEHRVSVLLTCPTLLVVNWLPPWYKFDKWPKMKQFLTDRL